MAIGPSVPTATFRAASVRVIATKLLHVAATVLRLNAQRLSWNGMHDTVEKY